MTFRIRLILIAGAWANTAVFAASPAPMFQAYAVKSVFTGRPARIRLTDADAKRYTTILRQAARRKPNFAGHYVLASWGCGASCSMSAAVDLKTGNVTMLPFTVCCSDADVAEPLEFRLHSRLLVIRGSRNETGNGTYYYDFDGKRFTLLLARENAAK